MDVDSLSLWADSCPGLLPVLCPPRPTHFFLVPVLSKSSLRKTSPSQSHPSDHLHSDSSSWHSHSGGFHITHFDSNSVSGLVLGVVM